MSFLSKILGRSRHKGSRSNPSRPFMPLFTPQENPFLQYAQAALAPSHHVTTPIPQNSGYVLLTHKKDHDNQMMGRHLEFDSNRGNVGGWLSGGNWRGEAETVKLDGQIIWKGQIKNTSIGKLRQEFLDVWTNCRRR